MTWSQLRQSSLSTVADKAASAAMSVVGNNQSDSKGGETLWRLVSIAPDFAA